MSIEEYDGIMETVRNEIMEAIENLALMTQREFMSLRGEMKTMDDDIQELREDIGDMRQEMHAGFAAINGMIVNHEIRIERVEKKTGIS
jgi:hypothetical protein